MANAIDPSISESAVATAAAAIEDAGWAVLPAVIDAATLETLRAAFEEVLARERPFSAERGWVNDVYQAMYDMPQKHAAFRDFAARYPGLPLARRVLGERCRLSVYNAHGMTPGGRDQELHPDQDLPAPGLTVYLQNIVTLDDFTIENGCTRLVPGSHRAPPAASRDELERRTVRVEAPAGSIIAWDAGLLHGGCRNATTRPRRALSLFFARHWVRPHCDFNRSLSPEVLASLDPALARLLGVPDDTPWYDWRTDRRWPAP